jgi:hypothetical protein
MYLMHLLIGYQNSYNKSKLVIVSAVPFISAGAFSAIKVDSRGESDTTTIPKRVKKARKKFMLCRIQTEKQTDTGQKYS